MVQAIMRVGASEGEPWTVVHQGKQRSYRPQAIMRFSSPLMMRDAVLAGAGVSLVSLSIVKKDLEEGQLVSWGASTQSRIEGWVLHASRRLMSPKVTAFVTFLCAYFPNKTL